MKEPVTYSTSARIHPLVRQGRPRILDPRPWEAAAASSTELERFVLEGRCPVLKSVAGVGGEGVSSVFLPGCQNAEPRPPNRGGPRAPFPRRVQLRTAFAVKPCRGREGSPRRKLFFCPRKLRPDIGRWPVRRETEAAGVKTTQKPVSCSSNPHEERRRNFRLKGILRTLLTTCTRLYFSSASRPPSSGLVSVQGSRKGLF